tara:strand:- start:51 stop:515 length:465 start_codon:yes stop_codon:yes gene_type:complete
MAIKNTTALKQKTSRQYHDLVDSRNHIGTQTLTAATTLTANDSGKTFFLDQTANFGITCPAPAEAGAGWNATFILATVASNAITITCVGTDLFHGIGLDGENAAQTVTEGTGIDLITVISGATKGDRVELICDGSHYYVKSFAADKAHITFAAE